jgi:hypothetical protein
MRICCWKGWRRCFSRRIGESGGLDVEHGVLVAFSWVLGSIYERVVGNVNSPPFDLMERVVTYSML